MFTTTFTADDTSGSTSFGADELFLVGVGTWDSGTLKVEFLGADGTWRDFPGASLTADGSKKISIPNGRQVRLDLSGSTSPSLYVELAPFDR